MTPPRSSRRLPAAFAPRAPSPMARRVNNDTLVDTVVHSVIRDVRRKQRRLRLLVPALPLALGVGLAFVVDGALPSSKNATRGHALAAPPAGEDPAPVVVIDTDSSAALAVVVTPEAPTEPVQQSEPAAAPPVTPPGPSTSLSFDAVVRDGDRYHAATAHGSVVLTRDPRVEAPIARMLEAGKTPYAAVVVLEAQSGRVVAVVEHSTREPQRKGLAFEPFAKAASVFKIVTTSALLRDGVDRDRSVCFWGGKTRMTAKNLVDDPRRDRTCIPFADVLPLSANVAIAKLANKHLSPAELKAEARRFGLDAPPPFELAVPASTVNLPDDAFGFANTAAGFGDVRLSALQGAVLASVVANGGLLVPPRLVDDGAAPAAAPTRAMSRSQAQALHDMLEDTVTRGTARRVFQQTPRLGKTAAGKTGSLADYSTGLETSWFVGYAPADEPAYVVAAVVVNTPIWHIRATQVAKEALRAALQAPPRSSAALAAAR